MPAENWRAQFAEASADDIFNQSGTRFRSTASLAEIQIEDYHDQIVRVDHKAISKINQYTDREMLEMHMAFSSTHLLGLADFVGHSPALIEAIPEGSTQLGSAETINESTLLVKIKQKLTFKQPPCLTNYLGLIYMGMASFLFALSSLCIKMIATTTFIPNFQIVFLRSLLIGIFNLTHQVAFKVPHLLGPPEIRGLLVFRGIIGFVGQCLGFFGLIVLSIGDSTSLGFTAPVFTGIFGRILLKEPWELLDAIAAVCSLFGVIFIARPSFLFHNLPGNGAVEAAENPLRHWGIIASLLSALTGAGAFILVRKLSKVAHATHTVAYLSYTSVICSIFLYPLTSQYASWVWPADVGVYAWFFLLGICGYMGQVLFALSLKFETAAKASTYNYLQVFFSFAFEVMVFHVTPNPWSIIGASVIGLSIAGIFIAKVSRERRLQQQPQPATSQFKAINVDPLQQSKNGSFK